MVDRCPRATSRTYKTMEGNKITYFAVKTDDMAEVSLFYLPCNSQVDMGSNTARIIDETTVSK